MISYKIVSIINEFNGGSMRRKDEIRSALLLILLVIIWGITFSLEKMILSRISPFSLNISRFFVADVIMLILFFPTIKKDFVRVWKEGTILGLLISFGYIFQTWGLVYTTPAKSGFITSLYVVLIPFVAIFVERISIRLSTIFALLIATAGIYLSNLSGEIFSPNYGDLLTLGCAIAFAFQVVSTTVLTKRLKNKHITLTFYQMMFVTITNIPFYFLSPHHDNWDFKIVAMIAVIAIFASVFGVLIQMKHQKNVGTIPSAFIYAGEPIVAAVFSMILMGERFSTTQLIGFSLIVGAAIFSQLVHPPKKSRV